MIACLEEALVKEAEQRERPRPIREECQKAILRVAELSSDDFHLDRHLYFSCRDDRERFCQHVSSGGRRAESSVGRADVTACQNFVMCLLCAGPSRGGQSLQVPVQPQV